MGSLPSPLSRNLVCPIKIRGEGREEQYFLGGRRVMRKGEGGREAGQTSTYQVTLERASKYVGHSLPIGALLSMSDSRWRLVCPLYTEESMLLGLFSREAALFIRKCYIRG